jgi:hypothetical protein
MTVLKNGYTGIGTSTPSALLHLKGNGGILNLEGTDHCFIQFYPDGYAGGRKGYFGYPGASSNEITLTNQITGGNITFSTVQDATAGTGYIGLLGPARITHNSTYDVWIQGGSSTLMGNARNLALLGIISSDRLCVNYDAEYTGGTWIDGLVYMPAVYSTTVSSPHSLYINSAGQIGGVSSSIKYKENVYNLQDIDWLFNLRPVLYNYKNCNPSDIQYGLIAEEVERINPLLVIYGADNKPDGLMYERLTVPMLKAIQDQKKEIETLKETINKLETLVNQLLDEK